jgi:hypothetical protein
MVDEITRTKLLAKLREMRTGVETGQGELYSKKMVIVGVKEGKDSIVRSELSTIEAQIRNSYARLKRINIRIDEVKKDSFSTECSYTDANGIKCLVDVKDQLMNNPFAKLCIKHQQEVNGCK